MAENLITFFIEFYVALVMVGIGVFQLKSKKPVGFYSGVKPPEEHEISDVKAWNKKHGTMWILYGVTIILTAATIFVLKDSVLSMILCGGGIVIPIFFMILYHNKLVRLYKIIKAD